MTLLLSTTAHAVESAQAVFLSEPIFISIVGGKHDPAKKEIHLREVKVGNRLIQCTTLNLPSIPESEKGSFEEYAAEKENSARAVGYKLEQPIQGFIRKKSHNGTASFELLNQFGLDTNLICQARTINAKSGTEKHITESEMKMYLASLKTQLWSSSTLEKLELVKPGTTSAKFRDMMLDVAVAIKRFTGLGETRVATDDSSAQSSAELGSDTTIHEMDLKDFNKVDSKYGFYVRIIDKSPAAGKVLNTQVGKR